MCSLITMEIEETANQIFLPYEAEGRRIQLPHWLAESSCVKTLTSTGYHWTLGEKNRITTCSLEKNRWCGFISHQEGLTHYAFVSIAQGWNCYLTYGPGCRGSFWRGAGESVLRLGVHNFFFFFLVHEWKNRNKDCSRSSVVLIKPLRCDSWTLCCRPRWEALLHLMLQLFESNPHGRHESCPGTTLKPKNKAKGNTKKKKVLCRWKGIVHI